MFRTLRLRVLDSVHDLETAIMEYLNHRNENPKPYTWNAKPEAILAKVSKARGKLGTLH